MVQPVDGYRRSLPRDDNEVDTAAPLGRVDERSMAERAARGRSAQRLTPQRAVDAFIAETLREAAAASKERGPSNDDVLYCGLNDPSTESEIKALRSGAGQVEVVPTRPGEKISHEGRDYDLYAEADRRAFVATLHLSPECSSKVEALLGDPRLGATRANIAAVAVVWARAENGGTIPSRMVISGHSGDGVELWGREKGLSLEHVRTLASAMPRAAARIEDLHVAACSSAGNAGLHRTSWSDVFPNLKTVWAYDGAAPSPAGSHLRAWSLATLGRRADLKASPDQLKANVVTWSASSSYVSRRTIESLRVESPRADARFTAVWTGRAPSDGQSVYDYRTYRAMSTHPNATEAERASATAKAEALLRLNHFRSIANHFPKDQENPETLRRGYAALGMRVPSFETMTRAQTLAEIERIDRVVDSMDAPPAAVRHLRALLDKYGALDPTVAKQEWCDR